MENADKNKEEGRRYFQLGDTYFNLKNYDLSIKAFSCVLTLVPYSVVARYKLAQSYDALGQTAQALEHYRWVMAIQAEEYRELQQQAQKRVNELSASTSANAATPTTVPDTASQNASPYAGAHDANATGAAPQPQTPVPASLAVTSRWWFWAGAGATVVLAGMTTYMGLQTLQTRDRWESEWNPADRDELKTSRMLTDVLLAATLATAAVWGVQVWKAQGSAQVQGQVDARAWHFSPACASGGCALTLTVHF